LPLNPPGTTTQKFPSYPQKTPTGNLIHPACSETGNSSPPKKFYYNLTPYIPPHPTPNKINIKNFITAKPLHSPTPTSNPKAARSFLYKNSKIDHSNRKPPKIDLIKNLNFGQIGLLNLKFKKGS
jgi:hypothetical protein